MNLPEFRWINTVPQQLETGFTAAAFHALRFEKYAASLLGRLSATASIGGSIWRGPQKNLGGGNRACVFMPSGSCQARPETTPEVVPSLLPNSSGRRLPPGFKKGCHPFSISTPGGLRDMTKRGFTARRQGFDVRRRH